MVVYFIMITTMLTQDYNGQGTPFEQFASAYLSIQLDQAKKEINHLRAKNQQATIKINSLEEEVARLKEQLQLAQQRHFGKKRDSGETSANQDTSENQSQTVASYTRQKKAKSSGRLIDLSALPHH